MQTRTKHIIAETIRVNHAGEYGACAIYNGQKRGFFFHGDQAKQEVEHMLNQEQTHLDYFSEYATFNGIELSQLLPFWRSAGYIIGFTSAVMGYRAAMACTVAVEDIIVEHYQQQLDDPHIKDQKLKSKIKQFQQEEQEHHDHGIDNGAENMRGYDPYKILVGNVCKLAISLAKRL